MNDPQTKEALESLADLFLTQGRTRPRADEPPPPSEADDAVEQAVEAGTQRAPHRDPLVGPSPIRLAPKLSAGPSAPLPHDASPSSAAWGEDPDFNPYPVSPSPPPPPPPPEVTPQVTPEDKSEAQGPALRYTGDEAPSAAAGPVNRPPSSADPSKDQLTPDPTPAAAMVEAVILGHLPGLAGPWLTQYAQLLADQTGPVLIIHVDEDDAPEMGSGTAVPLTNAPESPDQGRIDLELVEPNDQDAGVVRGSVRVPPRPPGEAGKDPAIGMIDAMVRARVGKVSTILVHLEADTDAKRLSRLLAIEDWTLLSGCDDIAVQGAASLLRNLAEADERAAGRQVALMVMGAEIRPAEAATRRIAQATEGVLRNPPWSLGCHPRLGPVNVRQLGSFTGLGRLWPQLIAYFEDLDAPEAPTIVQAPPKPQPEPARSPAADPAPATLTERPIEKAVVSGVATHTARRPAAAPRVERAAAPSAEEEPPRLAELVAAGAHGIVGGIALEARCPYQPLTELVLDEAGRLHLLRREVPMAVAGDEAAAKAQHDAGLRAAIVDLVEARKWVREHIELLKLTLREANFDAEADPTMHLFTAKAQLATPLVAKLGDQVRLHLLQQVRIGRESTWFTTPLN